MIDDYETINVYTAKLRTLQACTLTVDKSRLVTIHYNGSKQNAKQRSLTRIVLCSRMQEINRSY